MARRFVTVDHPDALEESLHAFRDQPGLSIIHACIDLTADQDLRSVLGHTLGIEGTHTQ